MPGYGAAIYTSPPIQTECSNEPTELIDPTSTVDNVVFEGGDSIEETNAFVDVVGELFEAISDGNTRDAEADISNWLTEVSSEESNRIGALDGDPNQFVEHIDAAQREIDENDSEKERLQRKLHEEMYERRQIKEEQARNAHKKSNLEWKHA